MPIESSFGRISDEDDAWLRTMLLWISGMLLLLQSSSRRRGHGIGSSSKARSSSSEFRVL